MPGATETGEQPPLIRDAAPSDLEAITAIYAHYVETGTASFEIVAPDVQEMRRRYDDIKARGLAYLVAVRVATGHRVAGYAFASSYRPRPAYRYTVEDSVYVDAACARLGLGKRLLAAVIERCTALGYRQMVAVIGGSDNQASIRLHASLEFQQAGRLSNVGRKFDRWIDSVLMQRALGAGASTPAT